MGRPQKQTVDYFPHYTDASTRKTLFILESKYGDNGYCFLFKLFEMLGSCEGHVSYVRNTSDWMFLTAKTRAPDQETAKAMLDILAELGTIDAELLAAGIIWSQSFVDNVSDAYRNRKAPVPSKPSLTCKESISDGVSDVSITLETEFPAISSTDNPHTILNKTILNKIRLNKIRLKQTNSSDNTCQQLSADDRPNPYPTPYQNPSFIPRDRVWG